MLIGHDLPDFKEWTPLHYAACNGQSCIVKRLLDKGADMEKAGSDDWGSDTPVHLAAAHGHTE